MARPNKIWFRKDVGWWIVTLAGKKIRLAQGRENRKLAQQKFHELAAVKSITPESPAARVADIIEAFLAWTKIHRTDETNRNHIWYGQKFSENCGYLIVPELKPIHVTRWVDGQKWGPTTERNARRSVYRAFSWACEEGLLDKHPLKGMKCPRARTRQRIMIDSEFRTLLKHSDRDFKILLFALRETGARPKEVRTLKWCNVRDDRWVLTEHKTVDKVHKPRIVYLTASMRKLMKVLRRKTASDFVFLNRHNKAWSMNAVRLRIDRVKKKTELAKDVSAYLLRHRFGTTAILNGVDVATVAELMGHSSLEMVSRVYLHLAAEGSHLQAAVERAVGRPAGAKPRLDAANPGG